MSEVYETIEYKGHTIEIYSEDYPMSPDEWENDGFLVHYHRQCWIEHREVTEDILREWYQSIVYGYEEVETPEIMSRYFVFPISAYIHSGVVLRLGNTSFPYDSGGWDTSHVGAVCVKKTYFGAGGVQAEFSEEEAQTIAEGLVNVWNDYLSGNVWGYIIDYGDGDSCWGYYGDEGLELAIEEAKSIIDYQTTEATKKHCKILKSWILNKVPLIYRTPLQT